MTPNPTNSSPSAHAPLYCVDMGTTRTRVWLVEGEHVRARVDADFGVRDRVRGETREWLMTKLANLVDLAREQATTAGFTGVPQAIVAAGMITSAQGLINLPHLQAPAGADDLAHHLHTASFPAVSNLPFVLVPGICTRGGATDVGGALTRDILLGEESLCIGLLETQQLPPTSALLNLGSHWKWIWIDWQSRIAGSWTSMTRELIHVAQTQTLIASALPKTRPHAFDPHWLHLGCEEAKRSGLTRALFCVRLLEQVSQGTPEQRLAFLYGAFLEMDAQALTNCRLLEGKDSVLIIGPKALAQAWKERLTAQGKHVGILQEDEKERAYLAGLRTLLIRAGIGTYPV